MKRLSSTTLRRPSSLARKMSMSMAADAAINIHGKRTRAKELWAIVREHFSRGHFRTAVDSHTLDGVTLPRFKLGDIIPLPSFSPLAVMRKYIEQAPQEHRTTEFMATLQSEASLGFMTATFWYVLVAAYRPEAQHRYLEGIFLNMSFHYGAVFSDRIAPAPVNTNHRYADAIARATSMLFRATFPTTPEEFDTTFDRVVERNVEVWVIGKTGEGGDEKLSELAAAHEAAKVRKFKPIVTDHERRVERYQQFISANVTGPSTTAGKPKVAEIDVSEPPVGAVKQPLHSRRQLTELGKVDDVRLSFEQMRQNCHFPDMTDKYSLANQLSSVTGKYKKVKNAATLSETAAASLSLRQRVSAQIADFEALDTKSVFIGGSKWHPDTVRGGFELSINSTSPLLRMFMAQAYGTMDKVAEKFLETADLQASFSTVEEAPQPELGDHKETDTAYRLASKMPLHNIINPRLQRSAFPPCIMCKRELSLCHKYEPGLMDAKESDLEEEQPCKKCSKEASWGKRGSYYRCDVCERTWCRSCLAVGKNPLKRTQATSSKPGGSGSSTGATLDSPAVSSMTPVSVFGQQLAKEVFFPISASVNLDRMRKAARLPMALKRMSAAVAKFGLRSSSSAGIDGKPSEGEVHEFSDYHKRQIKTLQDLMNIADLREADEEEAVDAEAESALWRIIESVEELEADVQQSDVTDAGDSSDPQRAVEEAERRRGRSRSPEFVQSHLEDSAWAEDMPNRSSEARAHGPSNPPTRPQSAVERRSSSRPPSAKAKARPLSATSRMSAGGNTPASQSRPQSATGVRTRPTSAATLRPGQHFGPIPSSHAVPRPQSAASNRSAGVASVASTAASTHSKATIAAGRQSRPQSAPMRRSSSIIGSFAVPAPSAEERKSAGSKLSNDSHAVPVAFDLRADVPPAASMFIRSSEDMLPTDGANRRMGSEKSITGHGREAANKLSFGHRMPGKVSMVSGRTTAALAGASAGISVKERMKRSLKRVEEANRNIRTATQRRKEHLRYVEHELARHTISYMQRLTDSFEKLAADERRPAEIALHAVMPVMEATTTHTETIEDIDRVKTSLIVIRKNYAALPSNMRVVVQDFVRVQRRRLLELVAEFKVSSRESREHWPISLHDPYCTRELEPIVYPNGRGAPQQEDGPQEPSEISPQPQSVSAETSMEATSRSIALDEELFNFSLTDNSLHEELTQLISTMTPIASAGVSPAHRGPAGKSGSESGVQSNDHTPKSVGNVASAARLAGNVSRFVKNLKEERRVNSEMTGTDVDAFIDRNFKANAIIHKTKAHKETTSVRRLHRSEYMMSKVLGVEREEIGNDMYRLGNVLYFQSTGKAIDSSAAELRGRVLDKRRQAEMRKKQRHQ